MAYLFKPVQYFYIGSVFSETFFEILRMLKIPTETSGMPDFLNSCDFCHQRILYYKHLY